MNKINNDNVVVSLVGYNKKTTRAGDQSGTKSYFEKKKKADAIREIDQLLANPHASGGMPHNELYAGEEIRDATGTGRTALPDALAAANRILSKCSS